MTKVKKLEAALLWFIKSAVYVSVYENEVNLYTSGCGCCSDTAACPPEILATITELLKNQVSK